MRRRTLRDGVAGTNSQKERRNGARNKYTQNSETRPNLSVMEIELCGVVRRRVGVVWSGMMEADSVWSDINGRYS